MEAPRESIARGGETLEAERRAHEQTKSEAHVARGVA